MSTLLDYCEIRSIIESKYGFKNIADYIAYLKSPEYRIPPSPERIDLLSPDNVDCVDFWKVCDELFGTDPVCNVSSPGYQNFKGPQGITHANRGNLWLAETLNILIYLREFAHSSNMAVLEIGAGYGSLKNWIETNTKYQYFGFDVVPRIKGLYPLSRRGMFDEDIQQLYGKMNFVISTNVFQHLSVKQRTHYFAEAEKLLVPGGLFIFNGIVDDGRDSQNLLRATDGNTYCAHYGQYTPNMKADWVKEELKNRNFRIHMKIERWDCVTCYIAQYMKPKAVDL